MLLQELLENAAGWCPDKTAVIYRDISYSYGTINGRANRLARFLKSSGLKPGDRVVLCMNNSVELVVALFGALKAGGVFTVVNPTIKADKLRYLLDDCGARVVVSEDRLARTLGKAVEAGALIEHVVLAGKADVPLPKALPEDLAGRTVRLGAATEDAILSVEDFDSGRIDIDLAAIMYTSGSTGLAKGVMLTHLNMITANNSINEYLESRTDDVILNLLPLSFDYGLYQIFLAFLITATLVMERGFQYPATIPKILKKYGVTAFPIVPTLLAMILNTKGFDEESFASVRYITNTGAALPPSKIMEFRKRFPWVQIFSMYGLTECKRVAYLPPSEIDERPDSVGKAMPNIQVFIVDDQGNRVEPNRVGELVIRGANIMKGYLGKPEETAEHIKPGRYSGEILLYSGDEFRMDEEGYLYFIGRKDDIIKCRGEKVSPRELEWAIYGIDGVAECAVIGVPHEVDGQAVVAFVVAEAPKRFTEEALRKEIAARVESFMVPRKIRFVEVLPKSPNGKIDKEALKKLEEGF